MCVCVCVCVCVCAPLLVLAYVILCAHLASVCVCKRVCGVRLCVRACEYVHKGLEASPAVYRCLVNI